MSPEKMWQMMRETEKLASENKWEESLESLRKAREGFSEWLNSDDQDEGEGNE